MSFSVFYVSIILLLLLLPFSSPLNTTLYIDCGNPEHSVDAFNRSWLSDRFYTGGTRAVVSEPLRFPHASEKTLRYFPRSMGKKSCYSLPLNPGRYYVRTFTVYDNYDGKSRSPSFDVSVDGTVVYQWRYPWPGALDRDGSYSDFFVFVHGGDLDLCFYSLATDPPVIGSLEIVEVDTASYAANRTGNGVILVNYGRSSCGPVQWGPGFSNDTDAFGRSWQSDKDFRHGSSKSKARYMWTLERIDRTDQPPNYFPMKLYQMVVMADELEFELVVDAKLDYLLYFHFAEIDSTLKKAGARVFDVIVNDNNVSRVDVFKEVGSFTAYSFSYTVKNLTTNTLTVKLMPVVGIPMICGLENYAIVPADLVTLPDQVTAMRELKSTLRVPERMGWNGDPCAPSSWDAWEGVTCHPNKDETALVIFEIDLGSQDLKGYISDKITSLSNLVSLNLSSNMLTGNLPSRLGQMPLARLDLSNNQLTGPVPASLASSSLKLVLLNDNLLEGQVPQQLFSIGVRGGAIDLSGNKGLCGVPPLPSCPVFWEHDHLSEGGKVAIGLSSFTVLFLVSLVVYFRYIRRGRNYYDFLPPHNPMFAAKVNKYQRQKSLMLLEVESQRARGLPSVPLNTM